MKKNIFALVSIALISIAANAWAFNRNLTGSWKTNSGDDWVIAHIGSQASFTTSAYTENTGQINFQFNGPVSGSSNGEDSFEYEGLGIPKSFRIEGKMCRMTMRMMAKGYVNGELGGRVIRMTTCRVIMTTKCDGVDEPYTNSLNCSGNWT